MKRTVYVSVAGVMLLLALSCSGEGANPVEPASIPAVTISASHAGQSQTHLWGCWDVYIDIESQTVEAVPNRGAMFAANVVKFLNDKPTGLMFKIISTPTGPGYIDVNIDVSITHPFPGMPEYNGYDVRGIFIGDGSAQLDYGSNLRHAVIGSDQYLFNADGYSRWFNPSEFPVSGLVGYTRGSYATKNYNANATLNPYKYFANGLTAQASLWAFLGSTGNHGVFASGATNTRRYELRFPNTKGVKYAYAVVANWEGESTHPANAPECVGADIEITDSIWWEGPTEWGGDLILDISLFNWHEQPAVIVVESKLIGGAHQLDPSEMIPTGGSGYVATYHVDIPATKVTSANPSEYWVIAEVEAEDYTCPLTPLGGAPDATLAAFFRGGIYVSNVRYARPPTIESGVDGNDKPTEGSVETYTVDAFDPDGDPITYSWTVSYVATGKPVAGYDGVPGDGAGSLDVDFGAMGSEPGEQYDIDCEVSDGFNPPVAATTLRINVWPIGDIWVSNNPDFAGEPQNGTKTQPYRTITVALNSGYAPYDRIVVDYGTYTEQVYLNNAQPVVLWGFPWYTSTGTRPVIEYGTTYPVDIYYTDNCTIRGFRIRFATGATVFCILRNYWSDNTSVIDCLFTGETSNRTAYGAYSYYSDSFTFINNKIAEFGSVTTNLTAETYGVYCWRGGGSHNISRNEITGIQPAAGYTLRDIYGIYTYETPNGTIVNNNLIHHIAPTGGSGEGMDIEALCGDRPFPTGMFAHNTIDMISLENIAYPNSMAFGMYIYDPGSTYSSDTHSNIVTRFYKYTSSQYAYGIYCFDGSDYCDVWDFPLGGYRYGGGAPEGPNSINADPLFVECDDEPYDYHLAAGSPCIGTGRNGEDMGCYGFLSPGQTVGLLTPE